MTGLESAALKAGNAVLVQAVRSWLARWKQRQRRSAELSDLITAGFAELGVRDRGRLRRKLEDVADAAGERLQALAEREFPDLDDGERTAALKAAVDTLLHADLSDKTLLKADADPLALAREVRKQVPAGGDGLGESGRALSELVLDHSCVQLVHLVRELPEYDRRLTEESLRRLHTALSGIEQVLDRLPVTSLDAPRGTDHDEQFRARYRHLITRHHDDLELIGVSVRTFRPRTALSVAYLSLTVDTAPGPGTTAFDELFGERISGSQRVEAALSRTRRILLRGQAGSGKSTLLSWLVVSAARGTFGHLLAGWNGCVPVLIKLRSFGQRPLPEPADFVAESGVMAGTPPEGWMHRQLRAGSVLLLVDGVDEVPDKRRREVRNWLDRLLTAYPDTRVVVTARPAAAGTRWLADEGFTAITLEDMSPADARELMRRWHDALLAADRGTLPFDRAEIEGRHRALLSQLEARPHLRNLTRNPLMCAMLCALNLDRDGDLPRNRKGLYEAALEMLLARRDAVREIRAAEVSLSYSDKLVLLQGLAHWLALNGRAEVSREEAVQRFSRVLGRLTAAQVDAESALTHLLERSGVLREPVPGRIDFVHRTFQEFLTAREAVDEGNVDMLVQRAHSAQWREIVIMAAGLFHRRERGALISGLLDRTEQAGGRLSRRLRLLAATCRESVHDLDSGVLARLDSCIGTLVPPRSTVESRSLATVGESVLDRLPADLSSLTESQAAACAYTAALVNGPDSLRLLRNYAKDPRLAVQDELIDAWPLYDPEEYAKTVLRDAPLHNGAVLIQDLALARWLGELRFLTGTHVVVENRRSVDLAVLNDVPHLLSITVRSADEVTFSGFTNHDDVRALTLSVIDSVRRFEAVGRMTNLRYLFLNIDEEIPGADFLHGLTKIKSLFLPRFSRDADLSPLGTLNNVRALCARSQVDLQKAVGELGNAESLEILSHVGEEAEDLALLTTRCTEPFSTWFGCVGAQGFSGPAG